MAVFILIAVFIVAIFFAVFRDKKNRRQGNIHRMPRGHGWFDGGGDGNDGGGDSGGGDGGGGE